MNIFAIVLFFAVTAEVMAIYSQKYNRIKYLSSVLKVSNTTSGLPSQYVSGSMHYFRVHPTNWRDRLKKLRWAGLHAVQTYIEWASHEPRPGVFDFSGGRDIGLFLQIAHEEGLFVILRPGPYICAERDMGGLPYWLLKLEPKVRLRTSDPKFMKYVNKWFTKLLPIIKPFMYENGGPIIMVQVENEYGNCHECDFQYITDLGNLLKNGLGSNTALFSTDNGRTDALKCSKIPDVFATVDFGPDANFTSEFEAQRLFEPRGPLINSEFYTGWLDHWGEPHFITRAEDVASGLKNLLELGASVNFYVFHGGTSFGNGAGSNLDGGKFRATPTSYDYDAPLNEAGDPTDKYFAIREVIKQFFEVPSGLPPTPSKKYAYGDIHLTAIASAFDIIDTSVGQLSKLPLTFEEIDVSNGLVAYQTILQKRMSDPAILNVFDVHDRGYVYIDQKYQGMVSREDDLYELPIFGLPNQTLTILVESQGRISVGTKLNDFKGLTNTPLINGNVLKDWRMIPITVSNPRNLKNDVNKLAKGRFRTTSSLKLHDDRALKSRMTFYEGILSIPEEESHPKDTFVRLDNWTKGYIWINGDLLGRYWPVMGPQLTLYVPYGILRKGLNDIMVLELEGASLDQLGHFTIAFTDQPKIDGPTPIS